MGNIIKSFLDLGGDTIDKLTNLDVGNLAILLPIENILEDTDGKNCLHTLFDKKQILVLCFVLLLINNILPIQQRKA